jgi:hypothetical protein
MYVAGDGCFTRAHWDGFGTADSGHTCLWGRNEVFMLPPLPPEHALRALEILLGSEKKARDTLFGLPHHDQVNFL